MNVLLITQTLTKGGSERTVAKLSNLLAPIFNVYILIIDKSKPIDYPYAGQLLFFEDFKPGNKTGLWSKIKTFKAIKKKFAINTSISFLEGPNFNNILSRNGDKVLVSVRGHKSSFFKTKGLKWKAEEYAIKLLYNFSDAVVAASQGIAEDLVTNFNLKPAKVRAIPNFYEIPEIESQAQQRLPEYDFIFANCQVLVTSGRLSFSKGQNHLLKIFLNLKTQYPKLKLMILGDGELYEYLLKFAVEHNLKVYSWNDSVVPDESYDLFFLGFVSNPFAFISKSTVFVFTSYWEGFPNALAEAIVCNTPVISSDCLSGPREILFSNLSYTETVSYPLKSASGYLLPNLNVANGSELEEVYTIWQTSIASVLDSGRNSELLFTNEEFLQRFNKEKIGKMWIDLINE
ncbi:glycosyltransferase [Nibribacter ruber]|uniref:Glycosyltransferase n=1 Tax=Nibribacter ruber TaxID=2698458 RepID=A0A6P1P3U7_9BACT|nr:glycosyltransferase [Nibribacter ruber]QHL89051.1 glycosyltransferase [Nibribacter ruber]